MSPVGVNDEKLKNAQSPNDPWGLRGAWSALTGKLSGKQASDELIDEQGAPDVGTHNSFVGMLFAFALVSAVLYFGRVLIEPVVFALFTIALVWPAQKALEERMPKALALLLSIVIALVVIGGLVGAIIWSVSDIIHWVRENLPRFQELYSSVTNWLEGHGIYLAEATNLYDQRTFVRILQQAASQLNSLAGFALLVFLLVTFGLTEMPFFARRFDELEPRIGWRISSTMGEIAQKTRKYMIIRTIASVITGIAVFAYTYYFGLELALAWGIIAFVLNFIPYVGTLIAVVLPVLFSGVQFQSWETALFLFIGLYVIQFIIGNYLEPLFASKAFAISPFIMLIAFFYWGFLWGLPGAFIGLPLTIAFLTIFQQDPSRRWIVRLLSDSDGSSKTEVV